MGDNISGSFTLTINSAVFYFNFSFTSGQKPTFSVSPGCSGNICVDTKEPFVEGNVAHVNAYIIDPPKKK